MYVNLISLMAPFQMNTIMRISIHRPPPMRHSLQKLSTGDVVHRRVATAKPPWHNSTGDVVHRRVATAEPPWHNSTGDAVHRRVATAKPPWHNLCATIIIRLSGWPSEHTFINLSETSV